jgi:hypothetical protein
VKIGDAITLNTVTPEAQTAAAGHSDTLSECRRNDDVSIGATEAYDHEVLGVPVIVPASDPPGDGQQNGAVCRRCGTPFEPGEGRCVKCKSFALANQEARLSGLRARHHPAELREAAEDLVAGIVADKGGESELSTLQRAYIGRLGDVEITLRILATDIATNGLLTPGGRPREVYDKFLAGLDRFDRLGQRIGLERHAKRVDLARALSGLDR